MLGLGAGAWLLASRTASGDPTPDDGVPQDTVAFFSGGACPAGWASASDVEGRVIVGASDAGALGVKVGNPMADREDRKHSHPYSTKVTLANKDVSAFGGGNDDGAHAGDYQVAGVSGEGVSGLPFFQMKACIKQ